MASEAKYHVFLSFRGEDTRDNFISHLYEDLHRRKGIKTFIDSNDLLRGEKISESLLKAIEESKIAIIVFSKGYASSTWCLEELAKIIDCQESRGLIVLPVFYHLDPSDVRKQTGSFGEEAFAKHEERFKEELGKVQRWRSALTKAANQSGFDSKVTRPESSLVDEIVKNVLERLNHMSSSNYKDLVGVESSINKIESLLHRGSTDVFAIGIWGMGGIGKTTLARAIFNKIKSEFEVVYFQDNVREQSKTTGLFSMQRSLLCTILKDENAYLESGFTKERLRCKKILLVLDDVTSLNQMEQLIGDLEHFGSAGSRIIITSRDKQVLQHCGVNSSKIYKVPELQDCQGLKLFSRHAFKQDYPGEGFLELSKRVVTFVKGVPLALKVFGGMLFEKSKIQWESAVDDLERISDTEIQNVLKLSFDELNRDQKKIFLDIACFYVGFDKYFVMKILNASEIGVSVLIDKSLINISHDHTIEMHDLLQEMGKTIVEEEHKDPGKRSRLWHHKDIHHVLRSRTGEAIEGMHLDMSKINSIKLNPDTFLNMYNLRFLDFFPSSEVKQPYMPFLAYRSPFSTYYCERSSFKQYGPYFRLWSLVSLYFCKRSSHEEVLGLDYCKCLYCSPDKDNENKVLAFEGLEFLSTELTFFRWFGCPLKSLPNSDLVNLVALVMPRSNIEQLGNGVKGFNKLKHINLCHSKQLTTILDLSLCPDLESLILEGCSNLIEVPSSIQYLEKLVILNLRDCKRLRTLPPSIQSKSLEHVFLSGCSILEMAPKISGSVSMVGLDGTAIKELPIEFPSRLYDLSIENCSRLESLPSTIGYGKPSCRVRLDKMTRLSLRGCEGGQELVDSVFCLLTSSLTFLDLCECQFTKLPDSLCDLSGLEELILSGNNRLECIPANILSLTNLKSLDVSYCERLQFLPKLPELLKYLQVHNCTLLEATPELFFSLFHQPYKIFNFANCFKMDPNKLVTTVENALLGLQSKFPYYEGAAGICCPGNEIPEYFSCQNMGSSITLKLPLDCTGSFVRCMMCIVVTPRDHHPIDRTFRVGLKYTAKSKDGKIRGQLSGFSNVWISNNHFRRFYMESDHVLFWYYFDFLDEIQLQMSMPLSTCTSTAIPKMWIKEGKLFTSSGFSDSVTIDFYIDGCDNLQVKKCGVELLFDQDERKKPMEGSRGSDKKKQKMWEGQGEEEEEKKSFERLSNSITLARLKRVAFARFFRQEAGTTGTS